ncbi:hypothetical protein KL905_004680 [Ogataea polymorpha]|nr:hypothetical protein KL937_000487 [Ogataea polymorpha]KAG7896001.1 hypothetical protein KL936_000709 [Ogataea polymorpha]KAG7896122.1 hypothetical protein KL908_000636 [Ogataea polymorpha]KAG7903922.1 hypothetical protein KL935_000061 [Ogataea polymorpha]KAG7908574.1 hypothetical protein KL907_002064 [Ogataea polymorpha]
MSTQSIVKTLTPSFGPSFEVVLTLPSSRPLTNVRNTLPITIHLSTEGSNTNLGCYVYSIVDTRKQSSTPQVYQTLLNNASETLVELGKRIGQLVSKKYNVPSYVSLSGQFSHTEFIVVIQETLALMEEYWQNTSQ